MKYWRILRFSLLLLCLIQEEENSENECKLDTNKLSLENKAVKTKIQ